MRWEGLGADVRQLSIMALMAFPLRGSMVEALLCNPRAPSLGKYQIPVHALRSKKLLWHP